MNDVQIKGTFRTKECNSGLCYSSGEFVSVP